MAKTLAVALAATLLAAAGALRVPTFYSSSAQLEAAINALAGGCTRTMKVDSVSGTMRVVLEAEAPIVEPEPGKPAPEPTRALLFFGEHARE